MKISEVTVNDIKKYLHVYHEEDDQLLENILTACRHYIRKYTGLTDEKIDENEDLTIALFVLASELYDNRAFTVQTDRVNPVIKSILDMHSINLL